MKQLNSQQAKSVQGGWFFAVAAVVLIPYIGADWLRPGK